jgi:hypothetical protein
LTTATRFHLSEHRRCGDQGAGRDHAEVVVNGVDFDAAADGGQRQSGFQHREVVTDTRAWPGAEG